MTGSENEVRLQLKGGRTIKIVRTETPTGGMWSIPEMPEIAAHQNISVIRDRLRGKGLIASRPGSPDTMAVEDRFYFGKGRKERFASRNPRGEDDLRQLLRASYLAMGDESDRAKIDRRFLAEVLTRPAYSSAEVGGGRTTHELVKIIKSRLAWK